jgi:hypothetical protein
VTRPKSKKHRLNEYLRERQLTAISEEVWFELRELVAPVSEHYLRELLRGVGLRIVQPYSGVRQGSFAELTESLLEIERVYAAAVAAHDRDRARACRRVVIQARDRAKLVVANAKVDAEKRELRREMSEWMLVWLENPAIFETWATLRQKQVDGSSEVTCRSGSG